MLGREGSSLLPCGSTVQRLHLRPLLMAARPLLFPPPAGYGYMSMLLAELLPPERVQKIVLLDKMWPLLDQDAPGRGQMSWNHIRHKGWPIPLETSKRDLKKGRAFKDLSTYLFNAAGLRRPFILIGVHLCSTLSIR